MITPKSEEDILIFVKFLKKNTATQKRMVKRYSPLWPYPGYFLTLSLCIESETHTAPQVVHGW